MAIIPLSLKSNYWETFEILSQDIEFIYNYLLELEAPQTSQELLQALVQERIQFEKNILGSQQEKDDNLYLPKGHYLPGQSLLFPAFNWQKGQVISVRTGKSPEYPPFEVISVLFESGEQHQFAAGLDNHILNQPIAINFDDPLLNIDFVLKKYGGNLLNCLESSLQENDNLVRIAGAWFPRALLVDVNIGHLNLAEALLEMEGGGPLKTKSMLEQVELPTDVNLKLTEFSMNRALQEDGRFDEVGSSGEVIWYLRRLEPEGVQQIPQFLKFQGRGYDPQPIQKLIRQLGNQVIDELDPQLDDSDESEQATISLIYPHWRAGTLPITKRIQKIFPTAHESPRVLFNFVDGLTQQKFLGWVVRPSWYVYGLKEWYIKNGLIPGSFVKVKRSKVAGEVILEIDKRRPTREWIRTVIVGADGGIVYAMLKQQVVTSFDERMTIAVPDPGAVDQLWESASRQKTTLEQSVLSTMHDLARLNPQGHVHAQELYAAVNIIRRCPPGQILNILNENPKVKFLGDLYFRLDENAREGNSYD